MIRYCMIFFLIFGFFSFPVLADSNERKQPPESLQYYSKNYNFSTDWFTKQIPEWEKLLHRFKGKPDVNYLEIGVFEGRSAIWMLENILTHPTAKLIGIDIFPEGTDWKEKYLANLSLSGFTNKATTIQGASQIELRKLDPNTFDIIYIDGCHSAYCALADAALSFELLKEDGILIFDDYLWKIDDYPEELRPKVAIDAFITAYRNYIKVFYRGNQVFIEKRRDPSQYFPFSHIGISPVGQYIYVWKWAKDNILYPEDMSKAIPLSDKERNLIEKLIKSTKFGDEKLYVDSALANDEDFIKLKKRLKLEFTNITIEE